uniref:Failed axon connections-like protein n=2 Tax=Meloidogyne TaxID=189290 RepID=A0A914MJX0_MELIC
MLKATHNLLVPNWKEGVVYLVIFPRTHSIPSSSPSSLKLETWLRMNNIKYQNVSNQFKHASVKGQVPFIELNGRQHADSNFIIEHLRSHFKLPIDGNLNSSERANLRAFSLLIEESFFRCLQYDFSINASWIGTDSGYLPYFTGAKKFIAKNLIPKKHQYTTKKTLNAQGYGRHSANEIEDIAKKDLMALSTFLGEKPYFFGNQPSTLDAIAFGFLAVSIYVPRNLKEINQFIEKSTPNLMEFVKRMKEQFWPDWSEICEQLALNTEDIKK